MTYRENSSKAVFARRFRVTASCVTLAAALLVPEVANAQPKPGPTKPASAPASDTASAEARQRFKEGIALADAGDHEAARLKFNQAWALLKSPAVLYNLARAEQLSGYLLEALEHYRLFGAMPADPKVTEAQRQRAKDNIAELSKKVGQIEVDAPAGARISVDGRTIDSDNTDPIPVAAGKHIVEARVDGKVRTITVEAPPGTITKATPVEPPVAEPPSNHALPTAPVVTPPAEEHEAWPKAKLIAVVGGGAVGFALLATSGILLASASGFDKAPNASGCVDPNAAGCAQLADERASYDTSRTASTVFFYSGLVVGALSVAAVLLWPNEHVVAKGPTARPRKDFAIRF